MEFLIYIYQRTIGGKNLEIQIFQKTLSVGLYFFNFQSTFKTLNITFLKYFPKVEKNIFLGPMNVVLIKTFFQQKDF